VSPDRTQILALIEGQIENIYHELEIQPKRMAQIQMQLDEVRAQIRNLKGGLEQTAVSSRYPKTMADVPYTGLVCPTCRQPVAMVENRLPKTVVFHCPACGKRWSTSEPDVRRQ